MARQQTLDLLIGVRIPAPQPDFIKPVTANKVVTGFIFVVRTGDVPAGRVSTANYLTLKGKGCIFYRNLITYSSYH